MIIREVTLVPSRPASGLSLTEKVMARVGGSIGSAWIATLTSGAQIVSATVVSVSPAMAMMSPAMASSTGRRSRPRKASSFERRACSMIWPSRPIDFKGMLSARRAAEDAAGQHAAEIGIGFERRRQHGEGRVGFGFRRRHVARG